MTRLMPPLIVVIALSGCASLRDTPQQAYVWEKGRICDARVPFWKMHRVEVDGRYVIMGATNAPPGKLDYFACMQEQFANDPYDQWLSQRTETR